MIGIMFGINREFNGALDVFYFYIFHIVLTLVWLSWWIYTL